MGYLQAALMSLQNHLQKVPSNLILQIAVWLGLVTFFPAFSHGFKVSYLGVIELINQVIGILSVDQTILLKGISKILMFTISVTADYFTCRDETITKLFNY